LAVDPRVADGLTAQLALRDQLLGRGAGRVGWKIGFNFPSVQRAFGIAQPISGFITTASLVTDGGPHSLADADQPMAEPEFAIQIGTEVAGDCSAEEAAGAIAAIGPAIEVVDIDPSRTELADIVATNVFHRGVAFGEPVAGATLEGVTARVFFNGEPFDESDPLEATLDPVAIVRVIAETIAVAGERLQPGDRIIGGSLVPPPAVVPGDELALDLGPLGSVVLAFTE
jgi:2-keto-4-pentenoate hydratase